MQATIMSGSTILKSENLVAGSHLMDEGANFVHYNSYSQADVDAFDCIIPLKVFGSDAAASNYAGGSIPKSLEFEIARETQGVK